MNGPHVKARVSGQLLRPAALLVLALLVGCGGNGTEAASTPQAALATPTATLAPTKTPQPGVTETFAQANYGGSGFRWPYRIHIQFDGLDPNADLRGCTRPVEPGRTTITFSGWIENLTTDRPAPNPFLDFESNLKGGTSFDNWVLVFGEGQQSDIKCFEADHYGDPGVTIPAGGKIEFTGAIRSMPDPPPSDLKLMIKVGSDNIGDLTPQKTITLTYSPQS